MQDGKYLSYIAFLFLAFAVMSSGFVTQILSCQVQELLHTNIYVKHVIGYLLIYVFIMLEGGWTFDNEQKEQIDTNWSNGNAIDSLLYAFGLYTLFLMSAKMQLVPNLVFYVLLFVVYVLNTQRMYLHNRKKITDERNKLFLSALQCLTIVALLVLIFGVWDYYVYVRAKNNHFDWTTFILGKQVCRRLR